MFSRRARTKPSAAAVLSEISCLRKDEAANLFEEDGRSISSRSETALERRWPEGANEHGSSPPVSRNDTRTRPVPVDVSQVQVPSGAVVHPRCFAEATQRRPPGRGVLRDMRCVLENQRPRAHTACGGVRMDPGISRHKLAMLWERLAPMRETTAFFSACPKCKHPRLQSGYEQIDLVMSLSCGHAIDAYCPLCDVVWPVSAQERSLIVRAITPELHNPPPLRSAGIEIA
jgi:hypothetical protein